jgi:hypothetical protein
MMMQRRIVPQEMLGDGPAMEFYLRINRLRRDWKWVARDPTTGWAMIEVWVVLA